MTITRRPCLPAVSSLGRAARGDELLCTHRGSFQCQEVHVHPRFSPDGRQIVFTSDARGYGNVYAIDVPEFDALPDAPAPA